MQDLPDDLNLIGRLTAGTRRRELARELPEAIDLLALVLQAGLDLQVAVAKYLESAPRGALWEEFSRLEAETRAGLSRADAFRALGRRAVEPGLQELARAVVQGLELGSSLAPILRTQAQALRRRRGYEAERQAAMAPLKLMFPLLVFIFPTILAVLFAPLILSGGLGIMP